MSSFLIVDFPYSIVKPSLVYEFSLKQARYEHEYVTMLFKDWEINYNDISPMSPVTINVYTPEGSQKEFNGYVHHIQPIYSPGERSVEVTVIGASYVMKNTAQTIYRNVTADQVLKKVARKYGFSYFTEPHGRVFPQIAQAGRTDWQLLVWLAKKVGYTLRAENTSLYFYPLSKDYSENRSSAKRFDLNKVETFGGTNAYSFRPLVGENLEFDDDETDTKSALAFSGVDRFAKLDLQYTKPKNKKSTRRNNVPEQFDRFAVHTVVSDTEVAVWEAEAAEERQRFGYRGHAEVLGDPELKPDMPIYLGGLGQEYSGYWVILRTEHRIERISLYTSVYTTILYLGIDSLGSSNSWGSEPGVTAPNTRQKRVIKPNVRNTQKKVNSKLKIKGFYNKKKSTGSLVKLSNKKVNQSPTWTSSAINLKATTPAGKPKPAVVVNRLLKG